MKQPYTFLDEERAIRFDRFDMPTPWINYRPTAYARFVSQAGGGMTWWRSPMRSV
jgi:cellobiose phosphorylase